jgi:hypothetical protein
MMISRDKSSSIYFSKKIGGWVGMMISKDKPLLVLSERSEGTWKQNG